MSTSCNSSSSVSPSLSWLKWTGDDRLTWRVKTLIQTKDAQIWTFFKLEFYNQIILNTCHTCLSNLIGLILTLFFGRAMPQLFGRTSTSSAWIASTATSSAFSAWNGSFQGCPVNPKSAVALPEPKKGWWKKCSLHEHIGCLLFKTKTNNCILLGGLHTESLEEVPTLKTSQPD